MSEWTLCTEHKIIVERGVCRLCNGDRNLIRVVPMSECEAAHAEVGMHASFLMRLLTEDANYGPEAVVRMLRSVMVEHHGFPTVDFEKVKSRL